MNLGLHPGLAFVFDRHSAETARSALLTACAYGRLQSSDVPGGFLAAQNLGDRPTETVVVFNGLSHPDGGQIVLLHHGCLTVERAMAALQHTLKQPDNPEHPATQAVEQFWRRVQEVAPAFG